ncbi:hypothetical protein G6F55_013987 [Rhizopus delemar]|nr:hypothetical protein G6F55_013987 [Rhizopus delemar]
MLDAASTFYKNLYSPQPVEQGAIDDLIGAIPEHLRLSEVDRSILVSPITYHDLLEGASRAPIRSSPGMDGLPYELLSLLIQHPKCRSIALAVFNNALKYGVFPPSWLETCVTFVVFTHVIK